jgi:hypothetical protein
MSDQDQGGSRKPAKIFSSGESFGGRQSSRDGDAASSIGEKTMRRTLIRYKAKPESADRNAELIAAVFAELKNAKPAGFRYLALRLEDDSFVHFVTTDADDGSSPLRELPAFQAFQKGIRDRCDEMPLVRGARIVGNYRMLETE